MITFNPIKAVSSFLFDEPVGNASTNVCKETDSSYRGRAVVSESIAPRRRGRVHFQGSWWLAECEQDITLAVGEVVQVVGRQNITLLVQAVYTSIA